MLNQQNIPTLLNKRNIVKENELLKGLIKFLD